MTTISAKVVADSVSGDGIRLTTVHMRYPRFIHAELMTHRMFSRNARSSRAVPVETLLREIEEDPVVPLHWGANQKGMQAERECDALVSQSWRDDCSPHNVLSNRDAWLVARDYAVGTARAFTQAGYHKQVVNRLLEPFMHIDVLVSATDWANFLALRDHHMAEPHIAMLARAVRAAMNGSTPRELLPGQWHLPYVDYKYRTSGDYSEDTKAILEFCNGEDWLGANHFEHVARMVSVARCARISYRPFDGSGSIDAEVARHEQLVGSVPMHASPAEHQATPDHRKGILERPHWASPELHGNFRGWRQYRKMLAGENTPE